MTPTGYTTAREHAIRASELLNGVDEYDQQLQRLDEAERLHMIAAGATSAANAQMEFWRDLAVAHAQTALALAATEEGS